MAMDGSWPSIMRHGLLSTSALLDAFEITGSQRNLIESTRRPSSVTINHTSKGCAVIRDNIPLRESALVGCLEGMTPTEWYELLNRHAFFWPSEERLNRLLQARAYRDSTHVVLTVSTSALVARYADVVFLSPINSGSTIYNPPVRGRDTLLPLRAYPFEEWSKKRGRRLAIAEVAVLGGLPNIDGIVIRAERRRGVRILEKLWEV